MPAAKFRKGLAEELSEAAFNVALANGKSRSRSLEEQRYHAGYSDGLQAAADLVLTYNEADDDE